MFRKIILQLSLSVVVVLVLMTSFILTIVYINQNRVEKENKPFNIHSTNEGFVQTIAYYLIKPVFESAFDHYIAKNGLTEYFEELKKEQGKDIANFYEITEGDGNKAFCGQEVLLQVYKFSSDIQIPFTIKSSDISLEIGKGKLRELGLGIIGMKEGGERVVLINDPTVNSETAKFTSYYVKLVKVKNPYPNSVNNLIIFDNLINRFKKQAKCGDKVSVEYSINKYNGEPITKKQLLKFVIGGKKVPLAIELGVIGMKTGNNRAVIAPPNALAVTKDMPIEEMNFDKQNISIINLNLLDEKG